MMQGAALASVMNTALMWPGGITSLVISEPGITMRGRAATPCESGVTVAAADASW